MTPFTLTALDDLQTAEFDTIIDVRAPAEFAEDHIPGAMNLPVLDDAERAHVGTIYAKDSPFNARKIGAALVAQNTAQHLKTVLEDKEGAWQPLVYCWRGGQRSGAFATILHQVGWRVQLLQGGYQSFRRTVVKQLYHRPLTHKIVLIEGGTGTAKTALLNHITAAGVHILDLEELAGHRGSLFGGVNGHQPPQKMMETRLAFALARLNPDKTTFVEAESSKIGERLIPPSLWAQMSKAQRIHIDAPIDARAMYLCHAYEDLTQDTDHLLSLIDHLRPYHAAEVIEKWYAQTKNGDWPALATGLISAHYDPRYAKSAARKAAPEKAYALPDLEADTLARCAVDLVASFS